MVLILATSAQSIRSKKLDRLLNCRKNVFISKTTELFGAVNVGEIEP